MNPVGLFLISMVVIGGWLWYRRQPLNQRAMAALKLSLIIIGLALLYLTITGKLHWFGAFFGALLPLFGAFFGALLPFIPKAVPWAMRLFGLIRFWKSRKTTEPKAPRSNANLTEAQAREILGVSANASRADIIDAHRKLMQKVHPDRGGNDWLAAQLNAAKDLLMDLSAD